MLMNLTEVFLSEGKTLEEYVSYEKSEILNSGNAYPISMKQPVRITLQNISKGKAKLNGVGEATLTMNCDRCLDEVEVTVPIDFTYEICSPEIEMTEDDKEEQFFVEDYRLDTDLLLNNEILILWPMKVLCHESCKGICPVCGKNLNTGDCGCDTFVPDPRMAKIKDIFNANKEV